MITNRDSILLVLPVPFRRDSRQRIYIEKQAANGMDRWADNFQSLIVACPSLQQGQYDQKIITDDYIDSECLVARNRIELMELPWAYKPLTFIKHYRNTRKAIGNAIGRCEYLSFAIGGLIGDWGTVAAFESIRQKRKYSIWTDWVAHEVVRKSHLDKHGIKRVYRYLRDNIIVSPIMRRVEENIIQKCDLGLFHGRDCYDRYSLMCNNPHLVHDIHLKPDDIITHEDLQRKLIRIRSVRQLNIVYAGRATGIKGPFDWIHVMEKLRNNGVDYRATWIGDGPLLSRMRDEVSSKGLTERVDLAGYISDRSQLLKILRDSDMFVFCHKTPESPRCLIEAIMSGCPIIGYGSPYSQDLVGELAKELLVNRDDVSMLAERIMKYNVNRDELARTTEICSELGTHYSDAAVFKHRSDLIKKYLSYSR